MYKQDSHIGTSQRAGNLYIRSLFYGNGRASYDSCERRHSKYRHRDHNVYHTLSDDGNDCDSQQDIRESEKYITASHNQGIDNSAVETCDQSENNTDSRTNDRRCQRACKRKSGTNHQTGENILSVFIGSPNVGCAWPLHHSCVIRCLRIIRNYIRSDDCH